MKIIHISPSYKPAFVYGGTTVSVAMLCEALVSSGEDIRVLTTQANGSKDFADVPGAIHLVDGVKVFRFKRILKDPLHFAPALLWQLVRVNRDQQIILHIHSWWNLTAMLSCLIAYIKNIPVVLSPRGTLSPYSFQNGKRRLKALVHYFLGKKLLQYCHIHVTSQLEMDELKKLRVRAPLLHIPNLVRDEPILTDIEPAPAIDHTRLSLLFLSRIEKKKGIELLFDALANLSIPWKLTISGHGDLNYIECLKGLSIRLGLNESIFWTGPIDQHNKYKLLAKNDLLVLFSFQENFANVVAESLQMGTPVAISNQVGLAAFVSEHDLGWVAYLDRHSVATTLTRAYLEQKKRQRIRQVAPKLVEKAFSSEKLIPQYLHLYAICLCR